MTLNDICPECGPNCHADEPGDPNERTWSRVVYGLTGQCGASRLTDMGFTSEQEALDWVRDNWLIEHKQDPKNGWRFANEKPPADMDAWLADMRERCQ